jgi:hypothetical protein
MPCPHTKSRRRTQNCAALETLGLRFGEDLSPGARRARPARLRLAPHVVIREPVRALQSRLADGVKDPVRMIEIESVGKRTTHQASPLSNVNHLPKCFERSCYGAQLSPCGDSPNLAPVIFYMKWCKMSTYEIVIACMKYMDVDMWGFTRLGAPTSYGL